jgi:hypothetical protein
LFSGIDHIDIDAENQGFLVAGDCLVDIDEIHSLSYFGGEQNVAIERDIEALSTECFCRCGSAWSLAFQPGCQIWRFSESELISCSSLKSICVPSSVEAIEAG